MFLPRDRFSIHRGGALVAFCLIGLHAHHVTAQDQEPVLIGYWPMEGDGADLSGGNRPLEVRGNAAFSDQGLLGKALEVHPDPLVVGAGGYAVRPSADPEFDFGANDFTIQAWVNYNQTEGEQVLIEKFDGGTGPGWTLSRRWNSWHFYYSTSSVSPSASIAPKVWHQVVVRRNGADLDIFFDGVKMAFPGAIGGTIPAARNPLLIGRRNKESLQGFFTDGLIDEVAIWNRALEDGEVDSLYNEGAGRPIFCKSGSISASSDCGFIPFEVQFSLETPIPFTSVLWQFGDGDFDISDPIVILTCLFLGTDCSRCLDASDVDDDGVWDITDAINLLYWRFASGSEPSPPFPGCGTDPTGDEIDDCEVFPPCP